MNIGQNIVKLRREKTMTQEDLAEELDVSRQAISKWEVGASKPDIDNLVKLSKLFAIPIDEIVNNEVIKTEALSISVKNDDKRYEILIWIRRFMILLLVFFLMNTVYRFIMLFRITSVEGKYTELSNYHYVITTYNDYNDYEEEEYWFKDGVSKTINTVYNANNNFTIITCIDFKNKFGYIVDSSNNPRTEIDIDEYLLRNKGYEKGGKLYSKFPLKIREKNILKLFYTSLNASNVNISRYDKNIFMQVDNNYINLQSKTLLPIMYHYSNEKEEKFKTVQYSIEFDSVDSIEI